MGPNCSTARGNWGCPPEQYPQALALVLEGKFDAAAFAARLDLPVRDLGLLGQALTHSSWVHEHPAAAAGHVERLGAGRVRRARSAGASGVGDHLEAPRPGWSASRQDRRSALLHQPLALGEARHRRVRVGEGALVRLQVDDSPTPIAELRRLVEKNAANRKLPTP